MVSEDVNSVRAATPWTKLTRSFPTTFWVANTLELFERLAFYGSKAVLAVFLVEAVGLGSWGTTLAGMFTWFLYSLPILAGTLVDRYGFRRCLLCCFAMFTVGYMAIGLAGMRAGQGVMDALGKGPYVVAALMFTAVGGSLIKPCIVGTVANTSGAETKALGYSIYYMLVNLGGAIGPIIAWQVRTRLGIEYVLVVSSMTSAGLLLATALFFREPVRTRGPDDPPPKTMGQVLADLLIVLRNGKFLLFLFIFSGFWIMFWQVFYSLPFYVKDVLHFPNFELVETADAWSIIVLQVGVTALTKRLRPILTMSAGFAVASFAWLLIPLGSTYHIVILAMMVFALGETIQAPRYYEYVADLAPKDQVGTYMGFAFLPVAIGAGIAGPLSSFLISHYMHGPRPASMWGAVAMIGFASTLMLVLYDRILHRDGSDVSAEAPAR